MRQYLQKIFKKFFFLLLLCFSLQANAEELFLEPIVQNLSLNDTIEVLEQKNRYFIDIQELSKILIFKLENKPTISGTFLGKDFTIDTSVLSSRDYLFLQGKNYFSTSFYESIWPIKFSVNYLDMQLIITSPEILPITTMLQKQNRQQNFYPPSLQDSFSNYRFDNRMISFPVFDFTVSKGWNVNNFNAKNEEFQSNTFYQANMAFIAGGLDTNITVFGNNTISHYSPRTRISAGRTFLDEPKNKFNLTTFEVGDINAFNSTLFRNSSGGRGAYASSFKDLVLSADKTINLSGPLSIGWEVELYQNNQLIGFRQAGIAGQYLFENIPVNYGLNAFRLVFYGPYGEIRTEEENYYSGTSPVKAKEFGYVVNAYQPNRFLFEGNEPYKNPSSKPVFDFTGYYGLNDYLTLIGGFTQSPDTLTDENYYFGNAGLLVVLGGLSAQYNLEYNASNQNFGHHFDIQGSSIIGDVFARYEYYGGIKSPISVYNTTYLKDLFEARLTGIFPYIPLPYYLSYQQGNGNEGNLYKEARIRISPNFMRYYSFTLENVWTENSTFKNNVISALLQAQYGNLGMNAQSNFRSYPDSKLENVAAKINYRWDKNTFYEFNWNHDFRSGDTFQRDLDTFSISAGRIFSFGGLNLQLSYDTDKNASVYLTYNLSIGKIPNQNSVFTNAQTKMSDQSSIYAKIIDENQKPVKNARIMVSGLQNPVTTDEDGEALITDISPYEKITLKVDPDSFEDISLYPEIETQKLVLRPGTVLPLAIHCTHKGGFEAQIEASGNLGSYKAELLSPDGKKKALQNINKDGTFIFDDVAYGKYELVILNAAGKKLKSMNINIDNPFTSISKPIILSKK